jgi:hypothetical protein
VTCTECLRIGAELVEPKLTPGQIVTIAGNCINFRHELGPLRDNYDLPVLKRPEDTGPGRVRAAAHTAVIVGTVAFAGSAAVAMTPGEFGHHGAEVVADSAPARTGPEVLAAALVNPENFVFVDGATDADGPSIVSRATPMPGVWVLSTRSADGSCTFLRSNAGTTEVVTTGPGTSCAANNAPATGWEPS